jgi:serpin B
VVSILPPARPFRDNEAAVGGFKKDQKAGRRAKHRQNGGVKLDSRQYSFTVSCIRGELAMKKSFSEKTRRSRIRIQLIVSLIAAVSLVALGGAALQWLERLQCERCDEAAQNDAAKLNSSLGRLIEELKDLNCDPEKWQLGEEHLRSLVGPYYGFRGGTRKCDVRFSVHGDEIWVCPGKGTRTGDKDTRHIYRIRTDLTRHDRVLPPVTGPCTGRRYPIEAGGMELCFTETMVDPTDCSFRFKRKQRTAVNMDAVRECEERRSKDPKQTENQTALTTNAINAFGVDLYRRFAKGEHNLVFSPFSIFVPLAMDYEGARGDTRAQIAQAIHADRANVPLHATLGSLISALDCSVASGDGLLLVANALWGQKGYGFTKEYQDLLLAHYGTGIKEVDFKGAPDKAEETINAWVSEKTQGKITQMIQGLPKDVEDHAGLLTANAIYFNCAWGKQFSKSDTKDDHFTLLDGNKILTPMMNQRSGFRYMETRDFQAVELPYAANDLTMVIFLPRKADGLLAFEKSITAKALHGWIESLDEWPAGVIVFLPRFYIGSRLGLSETLQEMGMKLPFTPFKADFSGISGPKPPREQLFIGGVVHQAGIDVSEEGTEAWAATMDCKQIAGSDGDADPTKPKIFRADHPFMFMIRHNPSQCILFMGRVTEPQ